MRMEWIKRPALMALASLAWAAEPTALIVRDPAQSYLQAMLAGDPAEAEDIARGELAIRAEGGWWSYLGAACAQQGRAEDAADAFRRANVDETDRALIWWRARALAGIRTYARAHAELARLAERFPHTRLAADDQELALRIEQRLAQPVSAETLAWYRQAGRDAVAAGRDGLAAEYWEEWLVLATRSGALADPHFRLELAGALLRLGDHAAAWNHCRQVPPGHGAWRGALFQALALRGLGCVSEAETLLTLAATTTIDGDVRARAQRLLATVPAP